MELERVRRLSDEALVTSLNGLMRTSRGLVAQVIAHLCEVEERRLHLLGGYASMFAYCISRLGTSEDEAYRRIEVARLARRFPVLFEKLASGRVSLSVAALLKAQLSAANHCALLEAVSGKTVQQAREVLAAWFPKPDLAPLIRKLPTRQPNADPAPAPPSAETPRSAQPTTPPPAKAALPFSAASAPAPRSAGHGIEPLSPERYKVQLTASGELKRKLELARDLMRHAVPSGDLATIVERAIDLLLEQTHKRRFGQTGRAKANASPRSANEASAETAPRADAALRIDTERSAPATAEKPPPTRAHRYVPKEVRRTVLARDGLRCSWCGPDGVRCDSRAWLEHDHITPVGRGGAHQASNIRHLCRAHNQLAAELAFGRKRITLHIARRRARPPNHRRAPSHDRAGPDAGPPT